MLLLNIYILSQKRNDTYIDYSANVQYICYELLFMKYEFVVRMENSVDPDQLASDLELHCFQKRVFL